MALSAGPCSVVCAILEVGSHLYSDTDLGLCCAVGFWLLTKRLHVLVQHPRDVVVKHSLLHSIDRPKAQCASPSPNFLLLSSRQGTVEAGFAGTMTGH